MRQARSTWEIDTFLSGDGKIIGMSTPAPFRLHDAVSRCDEAEVLRLIQNGAQLNELDEFGMTPLHCAVYCGYTEIVKLLIDAGADVNAISTQGTSALWHAEDDFGLHDIAALLRAAGAEKEVSEQISKRKRKPSSNG